MKPTLAAHLALFAVALIYAGNYTIAKEVMPTYLQPFGFIVMRVVAGTALFWIFHSIFVKERVERKDFPMLILCAVFGVAVNQLAFFKGLNWTTPINASLIMLSSPIMVLVASAILGKENITWKKIIGIVIGTSGAALLIGYGQKVGTGVNGWKGDILIFVNATAYGLYLVIVRPLIKKYHPTTVVKWVFTFALFIVIPFGWKDLQQTDWSSIPTSIWLAIAYVLAAVTFLTYLFNAFALSKVSSTTVGAYIYLQPILATIIAISFGKDELSNIKIISSILIFIGVFLVSQPAKKSMRLKAIANQ